MGLFNFYKPNEEQKGKSYVKQLFMVALSDGHLDQSEHGYIIEKAKKYGLSSEEIKEIENNLPDIKLVDPKNKEERFQLIYDLIWVMMIDGKILPGEVNLCSRLAMKIGYDPEIVEDLVKTIQNNLIKGVSAEETYDKLISRMK